MKEMGKERKKIQEKKKAKATVKDRVMEIIGNKREKRKMRNNW